MFFKENVKKIFIGIILGFSIIIPGLSGSAIAISLNLYDEIIHSVSTIIKDFKKSFMFLFPFIIGGVTGLLIGVLAVKIILKYYPFYVICFFSGLMIGTFPIITKQINFNKKNRFNIILLIIGTLIPVILSLLSLYLNINNKISFNVIDYIIYIVIGICLAITQLVPGLSATVFLIVIGYYNNLLSIVDVYLLLDYRKLLIIICIIIGLIIGILLFSKIINNTLKYRKNEFMHLVCGLSFSSILCVFIEENCLKIYKTFNSSNIIINLLIGSISLVLGVLITTIIFDKGEKKEK